MSFVPSGDLVSIIVPVYNSAKSLQPCIDSVLKQSYTEIEVIIIDDGSTDNSGDICDSYASKDDRVRVSHTQNRGASAARNAGISNSTGAFIFFIDSDDLIEPHAIQSLVDGHDHSRADLVVGAFNKVTDGAVASQVRDFSVGTLLARKDVTDYVMSYLQNPRRHQMLMSSWGKLFRSAIIRKYQISFDPELRTSEDVAFNFHYLKHIETVFFINEVIYNQQKHGNYTSLSMRLLEHDPRGLFGFVTALNSVREFLQNARDEAVIDRAIGQYYIYHVILYLIRVCGQINEANKRQIYGLVHELIDAPDFRRHIEQYIPATGNYKAIPLLMRAGYVLPVIWACSYEAHRLYGKRRGTK